MFQLASDWLEIAHEIVLEVFHTVHPVVLVMRCFLCLQGLFQPSKFERVWRALGKGVGFDNSRAGE